MRNVLMIMVSLFVLSSCYNDNEEDLYGLECKTENLTYGNDLEEVIATSCATAGCHAAGTNNKDYSSYNKIIVDTGIIFERSIVQKDMPPSEVLSDCNYKLLQSWIVQGAQQ